MRFQITSAILLAFSAISVLAAPAAPQKTEEESIDSVARIMCSRGIGLTTETVCPGNLNGADCDAMKEDIIIKCSNCVKGVISRDKLTSCGPPNESCTPIDEPINCYKDGKGAFPKA